MTPKIQKILTILTNKHNSPTINQLALNQLVLLSEKFKIAAFSSTNFETFPIEIDQQFEILENLVEFYFNENLKFRGKSRGLGLGVRVLMARSIKEILGHTLEIEKNFNSTISKYQNLPKITKSEKLIQKYLGLGQNDEYFSKDSANIKLAFSETINLELCDVKKESNGNESKTSSTDQLKELKRSMNINENIENLNYIDENDLVAGPSSKRVRMEEASDEDYHQIF